MNGRGLSLKEADYIVREAKLAGWPLMIRNAESYGLTPEEMWDFWQQNQHMTPRDRFPYRNIPGSAGEMPAAEAVSNHRKASEVA